MTNKQTIINRCQRKVDNLNKFVSDCINECGGETDLYLDNSSTVIGSPEHVSPQYRIDSKGRFMICGTFLCYAYWYDKETREWYIPDDFDEMIKWEKACVRRGVRYFKEYNPDWDNDVDKVQEFIENL